MNYQYIFGTISILLILSLIDGVLAGGFALLAFLSGITFLALKLAGFKDKKLYILLGLAIFFHAAMVIFMYLTGFQPFSGGDYELYDQIAKIISDRLHRGDFSIGNTGLGSWYPVIVGYIYALLGPNMFFGQMLNAWACAVAAVVVYLIVLQIGRSENEGFWMGIIAALYPSFIFFGSSMLKEALVVLFAMTGLLFVLKLIQNFSWPKFAFFYLVLVLLTNLRFYVSFAIVLAFIFCWFLFSDLERKKKLLYGFLMVLLLGFLPQISGYGYFGKDIIAELLNPAKIIFYREKVYAPMLDPEVVRQGGGGGWWGGKAIDNSMRGAGSSFVLETNFDNPFSFVINNCLAFVYVALGPFPWQINHVRQLLVLPETFAWYFFLLFIVKGSLKHIKQNYKVILPLIIFSILIFGVQALYASNFGIIVRIRIPAFLSLLCLFPLGFSKLKNIKIPLVNI